MSKRAFVTVTPDFATSHLSILEDAGLRFVGTLSNTTPETLALIIEGDMLPDECEDSEEAQEVTLTISREHVYGSQAIYKVANVTLIA